MKVSLLHIINYFLQKMGLILVEKEPLKSDASLSQIREAKERAGIPLRTFSLGIGVSESTISLLLSGKRKNDVLLKRIIRMINYSIKEQQVNPFPIN